MSDCYDYGDPKDAETREPAACAYCGWTGGLHYDDCPEVQG